MTEASKWIWGTSDMLPDEYYSFLFHFDAQPGQSIRLQLSCDSDYTLRLNGAVAAFGQYPDYPYHKAYDEIDLSAAAHPGRNEVVIDVWYTGIDTQTYIQSPAGLRYELWQDDTLTCASSEETLCRPIAQYIPHRAELITTQLGLTFAYDSTRADAPYAPSCAALHLPKRLRPRPIKKLILEDRIPARICQHGSFRWNGGDNSAQRMQQATLTPHDKSISFGDPLRMRHGHDGVYMIVDLGAENVGFLSLDIDAPTDCDTLIGWGEHLTDGRCRTAVRNFSCQYRACAGHSSYTNHFRRFGCRYIQIFIEAESAAVGYLGVRPTTYPVDVKPFSCPNPLRRRIYETCVRTLQMCMHDHYEDCPWREQALYTLDSRNQMLCGYYAFGETAFPRASLDLISRGMRPDGLLSLCYPAGLDFPIPAFSLVYFIQMREYLDHSGDVDFIRTKYGPLCVLMQRFLEQPRERGLIENFHGEGGYWNFYEWSDGMSGRFNEQHRSIEAPLNAFLSLALQNLAVIAEQTGHSEDAQRLLCEAETLNRAIADFFYDPSIGLFESFDDRDHDKYSVLTNSLCLLCGAADHVDQQTILRILTANGAAGTGLNVIPSTLSMNCFRFDALLKINREKYAPIILDEIDTAYGAMLDRGATTFWETALGEADFDGAGSLCHGWSALPVYYYSILL